MVHPDAPHGQTVPQQLPYADATDDTGARDTTDLNFLQLVVVGDYDNMRIKLLPGQQDVVVGRAEDADVQLSDPLVSRRHAVVSVSAPCKVKDLASRNGTFVHGKRIDPHVHVNMDVGEVVSVGRTLLVLRWVSPDSPSTWLLRRTQFLDRLREECARGQRGGEPFGVVRVQTTPSASVSVEAVLEDSLRSFDVVGVLARGDYALLFPQAQAEPLLAILRRLEARLDKVGVRARCGVACYPMNGTSPSELLAACLAPPTRDGPHRLASRGAIARLEPMMDKIAASDLHVLVFGETGVGKQVFVEHLVSRSPRAAGPLVHVNCAALSENLLEAELFGFERGAFTGAVRSKAGLMEMAHGGFLMLDEVAEIPVAVQAKLLLAIETKRIRRLGSLRDRRIDVRIVAATNKDLVREVADGRFRADLFYRLNGYSLTIPPLRERREEIVPLARIFAEMRAASHHQPVPTFAPDAVEALEDHDWPGNARELHNVIDRAMMHSVDVIHAQHLTIDPPGTRRPTPSTRDGGWGGPEPLARHVEGPPMPSDAYDAEEPSTASHTREKQRIIAALQDCGGNQTRAARLLGMSLRTLVNRLDRYSVSRPRKRNGDGGRHSLADSETTARHDLVTLAPKRDYGTTVGGAGGASEAEAAGADGGLGGSGPGSEPDGRNSALVPSDSE